MSVLAVAATVIAVDVAAGVIFHDTHACIIRRVRDWHTLAVAQLILGPHYVNLHQPVHSPSHRFRERAAVARLSATLPVDAVTGEPIPQPSAT